MPPIKKTDIYDQSDPFKVIRDSLIATEKVMNDLIATSKTLSDQYKNINKSGSGREAKNLIDVMTKQQYITDQMSLTQKERLRLTKLLSDADLKATQITSDVNKELVKRRLANQEATKALKDQIKAERDEFGTIQKLKKANSDLVKQRESLNLETKKGIEQYKLLTSEIKKNEDQLKKYDAAIGRSQRNVGNYRDAIKGMMGAFTATAAIAALKELVSYLFETGKEVAIIQQNLKGAFDGENINDLTVSVRALASTFDESEAEIIKAANAISKEFGITGAEALAKIQEGFEKGSNANGEFIEILKEYPAQFKAAGIDAETTFAIINQSANEGIYSDKGADAIKEAGLRLRENTKAVEDALKPLDESVKKQIEQEIAAGNSFKAIQLVSEALKDTSLTAEQSQTIIADVFGGAGEDAGIRYIQMLSNVNTNLDDVESTLSSTQQATLDFNEQFEKFTLNLLDADSGTQNLIAGFIEFAANLLEVIQSSNGLTDTVGELVDMFSELFGALDDLLFSSDETQTSVDKLTTVFDVWGGILKFVTAPLRLVVFLLTKVVEASTSVFEWIGKTSDAFKEFFGIVDKTAKGFDNYNQNTKITRQATKDLTADIENITAATKDLTKAQKDNQEQSKKRAEFETVNSISTIGSSTIQAIDPLKQAENLQNDLTKIASDGIKQRIELENEANLEISEAKTLLENELQQQITNIAINAVRSRIDSELQLELNKLDKEEKALKIQLDNGLITEQQYQDQVAQLQKDAAIAKAKADQKAALFDIGIATAIAIVKALPNVPLSLAVGAAGALQAAAVLAQPLPTFGEGGWIDGKKHSQGGTIIEAEKGEFITKASSAQRSRKLLDMINKGLISDNFILNSDKVSNIQDYSLILKELRLNRESNNELLKRTGIAYDMGSHVIINRADGSIEKIIKPN